MHDIYIAFTCVAVWFADTCTHSVPIFWNKLKLCRQVKAVLPAYTKFGFIHALRVCQQVAFQLFSIHWVYTTIFRKLNEGVIRHLFAKSTPDENWTYGNFSAITTELYLIYLEMALLYICQ